MLTEGNAWLEVDNEWHSFDNLSIVYDLVLITLPVQWNLLHVLFEVGPLCWIDAMLIMASSLIFQPECVYC